MESDSQGQGVSVRASVCVFPDQAVAAGREQQHQMLRRWKRENSFYQSVQVNLEIIHLTPCRRL